VAEIPRILAFIFMCTVLGMLGLVTLKIAIRLGREAHASVRSWRDLRRLRPYERGFRPAREYEQLWRGES
jgi:hypothetical protein